MGVRVGGGGGYRETGMTIMTKMTLGRIIIDMGSKG